MHKVSAAGTFVFASSPILKAVHGFSAEIAPAAGSVIPVPAAIAAPHFVSGQIYRIR